MRRRASCTRGTIRSLLSLPAVAGSLDARLPGRSGRGPARCAAARRRAAACHTRTITLWFATAIHSLRGERGAAAESAGQLIAIADAHGFAPWKDIAVVASEAVGGARLDGAALADVHRRLMEIRSAAWHRVVRLEGELHLQGPAPAIDAAEQSFREGLLASRSARTLTVAGIAVASNSLWCAMKHIWVATVVSLLLLTNVVPGAAQDAAPVRVEGRVVWSSGQKAVIAPDGSPSVNVDLSRVPQDQYGVLRQGDRVVITGALPNERNRVIAATVERLSP